MLRVRLLGPLIVDIDGRPVEQPSSRSARELLAWLALHPGEHPRGTLAARFWPDVLDSSARASLRTAAWALRRALGDDGAAALRAGRDRVALRCTTDIQERDALLDRNALDAAAALHRGPLLADLDADWVLEERDVQSARLAAILARLAEEAPTPELAVAHARRRLELDPLDEAAARDLMERHAAAGDRAAALAVNDRLAERLRTQLGIAPAAETRATAERVRRAPAAAASAADAEPVVGRSAELDALLRLRSGIAVVRGEAGIGKTHLAHEVLERARAGGARTARCAALELGGPAPYSMWSELLRDLADDMPAPPPQAAWPEALAAVSPSLPRRLGRQVVPAAQPAPPEHARSQLLEAAGEAIEHAVADRPLVLLFDDVHVADAASLELLAYVLRRFGGLGVLAVLTCRAMPERPELDAVLRAHAGRGGELLELDLLPLARDDIERLVGSVAALDPETRAQVVASSDGNPLLAIEGARAAAAGHVGPPPSLRAVARAAIGRLPDGARHAAELAAAAGRHLSLAEVGGAASQEEVLRALDCGLLTAHDGRFGYRHALLRDAALDTVAEPRRRTLHEELAALLRGPAAETARHLRLAGRDDLAAGTLTRAARDAIAVGAVEEASAFLREALDLRPGDPQVLAELAHTEAVRGRRAPAEAALQAALDALEPTDHGARGQVHARAARWYSALLCRPADTLVQAQRAIAELDRDERADRVALTSALALAAWSAAVTGRQEGGDAFVARLAGVPVDDPDVLCELANAHAFRALAEERLGDAVEHFASIVGIPGVSPGAAYTVRVNLACILAGMGDHAGALRQADEAVAEVRALPGLVVPLHALRAKLLTRLDRLAEARDAVAQERAAAERSGDGALLRLADHDAGMVAAAAGDHAAAAELIARALAGDCAVNRPLARLTVAESLARLGRVGDAEAELRAVTLEPVGPADGPAALVARLTHVQALVARGRGDEALAERRLREAAAAWRRVPRRVGGDELAAVLVDLGRPTLAPVEPARELERVERELRHGRTRDPEDIGAPVR